MMSTPIRDLRFAMDQWLAGRATPPRPSWSPITPPMVPCDNVAVDSDMLPPPAVPAVALSASCVAVDGDRISTPPGALPASPRSSHPDGQIFKPQTPPGLVPISESDNPDAIALRSALSILQMQKQQAVRDMQRLDRLKLAAETDPEGFAKDLAAGRLTAESNTGAVIQFTDEGGSRLERIPVAQNVVRMPPINWAKYQIVGESLDRLHDVQLRRPSSGEPQDVLLAAPVNLFGFRAT